MSVCFPHTGDIAGAGLGFVRFTAHDYHTKKGAGKIGGAATLAGAVAPRTRYIKYRNTAPHQAEYLVKHAEEQVDGIHARLCWQSAGRCGGPGEL
jgi:hypothetical protein